VTALRKLRARGSLVLDERVPGCECGDYDEPSDPCDVCEAWSVRLGLGGGERCYVCPKCNRVRPWSDGASDDTPGLCDDCAADVQGPT
jgi:hypothetical protein